MDDFINECREWLVSIQTSLDNSHTIDAACKEQQMYKWMLDNVPEELIRSTEIEMYKFSTPNCWDQASLKRFLVAQTVMNIKSELNLSF